MIAKRSKNRAAQEREYSKLRVKFLEDNPICQVKECERYANQLHHKIGRISTRLIDVRYFLAVCNECHSKIEARPQWAKANGYSLERYLSTEPQI